jgi:hypothetical protein
LLCLAVLALCCLSLQTAWAEPSFWNSRCASCHNDDSSTCNGCHFHRGNLNATSDADAYLPGDAVTVTLTGGSASGWIRGLLYNENNVLIGLATGPTGTGDDGQADPVVFPVEFETTAPAQPGSYVWEAAWYGGASSGGGAHLEERTPVAIQVQDVTGVPEQSTFASSAWSAVKALY